MDPFGNRPAPTAPIIARIPPYYLSLLQGCRILVAEDTPTNQEITLAVLELAGIETLLVDTGTKAVAAVQDQRFDAILMDIQMPEMDGFEAIRAIRRQKDQDQLPIIAMTAHTLKEDQAKCMAAGMNGYSQEKLFSTLVSLIHKNDFNLPSHDTTAPRGNIDPKNRANEISDIEIPGIEFKKAITTLGIEPDVFMHILQTFFKNHEL